MKAQKVVTLAFLTVAFASTSLLSGCKEDNSVQPVGDTKNVATTMTTESSDCSCIINPSDEITPEEINMITYMREEEKLARDVYITFSGLYPLRVFENIANSEQAHMDKVLCLLNYYNIEDPASTEVGVFNNTDLQELYNNLIAQGSASQIDALTVGATIEDLDINDLNLDISQTENEAIVTIFEHLKCGSTNHMRSFSTLLSNFDVVYTPQFISQDEYTEIINSQNEPCGLGGGTGGGGNQNNGNGDGTGTCKN